VVGDLLGGDESCVGVDSYTRTDKQIDWINGILGDDGNMGCGDIDARGRCDADVVSYCENDTLKSESCSAQGKVCQFDTTISGFRCVAQDACGNVTSEGECDNVTARWCENGQLQQQNCAQTEGLREEGSGNTRCVQDPCAGISGGGECEGDTAVVCIGQSRMEVDCSECGLSCKIGAAGPECN
jgi:hypothetical protein